MPEPDLEVRRATIADLETLVPLFDAYRCFYRQSSDLERARCFLKERLERDQSVIFLAIDGGVAVGFMQLYPSFTSTGMARIFILNDLFVSPDGRRRGVGSALLEAAAEYGRSAGAVRLALSTELTNSTAQALYERTGWKRDTVFCTYQLTLV
jgi:ribosomal protein S18 acetylase RimI-like enzyme